MVDADRCAAAARPARRDAGATAAGRRLDLPPRLSLFGHTRLPITEIELLGALATHHDLHLWLPHPSDRDVGRRCRRAGDRSPRREDRQPSAGSGTRCWPPSAATSVSSSAAWPRVEAVDHHHDGAATRDTLLGWLQADLRANAVQHGDRSTAADDRSVQVHSCHGAARQVDVLREVLLGLLQDDPSLEPRDILVMCPDIETYAPLITAGFGLGDVIARAATRRTGCGSAWPTGRLTQTNPLLGCRRAAPRPGRQPRHRQPGARPGRRPRPVRRRFGFTDDDLDSITAWVRESGIRWGFDQVHRSPFGLERFVHNTWQFGIDRVLTGVAMSDDSAGLARDDAAARRRRQQPGRPRGPAGRVRPAADRRDRRAHRHQAAGEWLDALDRGVERPHRGRPRRRAGRRARCSASSRRCWRTRPTRADTPMRLTDIRALLGRHLAGRPTRANFRTGTLTVCTMVPMRSVPHRVVCLVGLDDGVFPRLGLVDGDDALARDPMTGERDIRSEDRQLLLDAIGAATEMLVVTYTGANEHTGQRRPPAVPLGELLDALDLTTTRKVRSRIVVEHPLQPFDVRNVTPGGLGVPTPFTFDPALLVAAETAAGDRDPKPPFLDHPLPAAADRRRRPRRPRRASSRTRSRGSSGRSS